MSGEQKYIPRPPLNFNLDGWCELGQFRLRTTWFGLCVIEEFYESQAGAREWRRAGAGRTLRLDSQDRSGFYENLTAGLRAPPSVEPSA